MKILFAILLIFISIDSIVLKETITVEVPNCPEEQDECLSDCVKDVISKNYPIAYCVKSCKKAYEICEARKEEIIKQIDSANQITKH